MAGGPDARAACAPGTLERLREVSTPILSTQLFKLGFRSRFLHGLVPLGPSAPAHILRHLAVDADGPIGCAEVLVMPGDIMVGDAEGVICVPRALAETIAAGALDHERLEAFLLEKIKRGAPLTGVYPPNAATLAEYEARRGARG